MNVNDQLLTALVESAQNNKKGLRMLKNTAVRCQQFELASVLRDIERKTFPESEEEKKAKEDAGTTRVSLGMVGLNVSDKAAWLIAQTMRQFTEKGGEFSLDDATRLTVKADEYFDEN